MQERWGNRWVGRDCGYWGSVDEGGGLGEVGGEECGVEGQGTADNPGDRKGGWRGGSWGKGGVWGRE